MDTPPHVIGAWSFDPAEPVVKRGEETRRLEHRAARTLAVLCERRGETVGQDELITGVWGGRTVSSNSVAIVVGGLRRALDDDPQDPRHIITVPRRGYRLARDEVAPEAEVVDRHQARWLPPLAAASLAMAALGIAASFHPARTAVDLVVEPTRNDTGQAAFDTLARALAPVVVDGAVKLHDARILTSPALARSDARLVSLQSRLILWNGSPEVALSARDVATGAVVWSGFVPGPPAALARHTTERLAAMTLVPAG